MPRFSAIARQTWIPTVQHSGLGSPEGGLVPNGRSGGFPIGIADLTQLVGAIAGTAQVGMVVGSSAHERPHPADATEVMHLVAACHSDRVPVEEQDRSAYVIHLSN